MIKNENRAITPAVRAAWFVYKKHYSGAGKPNLVSFIAGWNAAKKAISV